MSSRLHGPFPDQLSQSPTLLIWVAAAILAGVSVACFATIGSGAWFFALAALLTASFAGVVSWLNYTDRRDWCGRFAKLRALREATPPTPIADAEGRAHIAGTVMVARPAAESEDLAASLMRRWGTRRIRRDRLRGQSAHDVAVLRQQRACGAFWVRDATGAAWVDPWEDEFEILCDGDDPMADLAATLRDGDTVEIIGVARALAPDEARTLGLEEGAGYRLAQPTVAFDDRQSSTLLVLRSGPGLAQR